MIDEKHSLLVRPKAVPPPMFTPNRSAPHPALIEMSSNLRKHDPDASRLHDCIFQVKIFAYNSTDLRWENAANIEGNLCAYERQQNVNGVMYPSFAFAVLSGEKSLIQSITTDMVHHADKLRLFYEVAKNGRREVFCIHFLTEAEGLRLHTFLSRSVLTLQKLAEQQRPAVPEVQQWMPNPMNGQMAPAPVIRPAAAAAAPAPAPVVTPLLTQTPTRLVANPPVPNYPIDLTSTPFPPSPPSLTNGSSNSEDPTSSLKRLLNIRSQPGLENLSLEEPPPVFGKPSNHQSQQTSVDLMPPSAFEPIAATPPSPVVAIGAERLKHRVSNPLVPPMNREHFRQVLIHLIQTDEHFLDVIYQACLTHPPSASQSQ